MAKKLTQAEFLQKSSFKVFVPEDAALRLSPTAFNDHVAALIKGTSTAEHSGIDVAPVQALTLADAVSTSPRTDENTDPTISTADSANSTEKPSNSKNFIDALDSERTRRRAYSESDLKDIQMLTENDDAAYKSSQNPLVDLFYELEDVASTTKLSTLLERSWQADPLATLKLIWNARSIHLGKSSRKSFYRCCGWLADNHPVTLLRNLAWVVRPVIAKKVVAKDTTKDDESEFELVDVADMSLEEDGNQARFDIEHGVAHGYWKDLLNILALAANDKLHLDSDPSDILNDEGRQNVRARIWDHEQAQLSRKRKVDDRYEQVQAGFTNQTRAFYKALHLSVARLFGEQLKWDIELLDGQKYRELSVSAKWAPTQKGFHDKHTLIVSTIAEYMFPRESLPVLPEDAETDRELYLRHAREAYRMHAVSPLRKALDVVERKITSGEFSSIKYDRIPSLAMNQYSTLFIEKDYDRFEKYIEAVGEGKKKISGATLLPATLVSTCRKGGERTSMKGSAKQMIANVAAQLEAKVVDGQWNTLVQRIRDSGTIENSIAVCDVSASMLSPRFKDGTCPMDSSLGLSLLLADITKPPFGGYFITFSSQPEIQKVGGPDDKRTLSEKIDQMAASHWTMNTDFVAVFEKLILPMAVEHNVKQEDMVKQIFVFSDMQFDSCGGGKHWTGSYERIKHKFMEAGYDMPQLIFWNLAGGRAGYGMYGMHGSGEDDEVTAPKPVTAEETGVALVSGYSQGQMKMFLENGQFEDDEEEVDEKEIDGDAMMVENPKKKVDPLSVVMKAISHRGYSMLKVVD